MRFKRPKIVTHDGAGTYQNGEQTTTANETQTAMEHLVLGDGTASHATRFGDGPVTVLSQLLPIASTSSFVEFSFDIDDNRQIFADVHIKAFGAAGMTELDCIVEFQDPHYPEFWIPSLEGVARTSGTRILHTWTADAVGSYVLATRAEHRHFKKVRFLFQANLAVDAATAIWVNWHTDGAPSKLTDSEISDINKVWS